MRHVFRDELSPLLFLRRTAAVHGEKVGVVDGERTFTYAGLAARCDALARALVARGVGEGERVAVLAPNQSAVLEAHFGVPAARAILCAVNTRLGPSEVAAIVEHSQARVLVLDPRLRDAASQALDRLDLDVIEIGPAYEAMLADAPAGELPLWPDDEERHLAVNYTSGTTGQPKGVLYTHRGAYLNALGEVVEAGLTVDSRYLWTLPMFHCNGWCYPWAVTAVGATHVCIPAPDPAVVWAELRRGITHLCAAPTVLVSLAAHPAAAPLEQPLTVVTAGAPPSPTVIGRMEALGARIVHVYGLTETYGPFTVSAWSGELDDLPDDQRHRRKARQGVPMSTGGGLRVIDEHDVDVPPDGATMGEVIMRGNGVMAGYLDDPETTAEACRDGWFHSGDAAVMHPDGHIEIRDRFKDVIISGGENISTIEVEQALVRHPAVLEAAVVAVPHDHWGERPKAFVTLAPGAEVTAEELIAFCRGQIAHFKCPDAVEFRELPKTSTGKVQKYVLREAEWAGRASRVN